MSGARPSGTAKPTKRCTRQQPGNWTTSAACHGHDPEIWFPAPKCGTPSKESRALEAEAKRICRQCPVQPDCLRWAVTNAEPYGVYGGLNETERKALHQ
jgi:WhiB family transcriptional regulator, redox-sensing transcriptional regulator